MDTSAAPVTAACESVPGGRSENQDRCYVAALDPSRNLWGLRGVIVVADGLGGHEKGEVAAQLAVDTATEILGATLEDHEKFDKDFLGAEPEDVVRRMFDLANERIYQRAAEDNLQGNMGTTMTALVVTDEDIVLGHVGDCRALVITGDGIEQITEDHSWVAEQVREGRMTPEEAAQSPLRGQLTQAIGIGETVEPFTRRSPIEPCTTAIVCSDGLTQVVDAETIRKVTTAEGTPEQACQTLVSMAVDGGTTDNVTVGVISASPIARPEPLAVAAPTETEPDSAPSSAPVEGGSREHDDSEDYASRGELGDGEGERTVEAQRSQRLAILAATCLFSLVAGLFAGKVLIGSRMGPSVDNQRLAPAAPPTSAGAANEPGVEVAEAPEAGEAAASETAASPGAVRIDVKCQGDLVVISSNEGVTYDVYPRGQHADFDSRLYALEGGTPSETQFRLPEAPPASWHEEEISLTIERLGERRIRIAPMPEDLEVFVDFKAYSGAELESLEAEGRRARIGFYFPPSREGGAYAIALADFEVEAEDSG